MGLYGLRAIGLKSDMPMWPWGHRAIWLWGAALFKVFEERPFTMNQEAVRIFTAQYQAQTLIGTMEPSKTASAGIPE